jgi:uncharacterized protein YcbK (DUF882 family)
VRNVRDGRTHAVKTDRDMSTWQAQAGLNLLLFLVRHASRLATARYPTSANRQCNPRQQLHQATAATATASLHMSCTAAHLQPLLLVSLSAKS